ncbi:hypothetical protein [Actinomadura gamaensis]|uniref:Uncharacterized protein n=1 Tax=Actinomadura gamaensis TaxID=1763541 RepID=A0ABV9U3Y0_9ACTN
MRDARDDGSARPPDGLLGRALVEHGTACAAQLGLTVLFAHWLSSAQLGAFALLYGHYLLAAGIFRDAGARRVSAAVTLLCDLGWGLTLGAGVHLVRELPGVIAEWTIGAAVLAGVAIAAVRGPRRRLRRSGVPRPAPGSQGRERDAVTRSLVAASEYALLIAVGALAGPRAVAAVWTVRALFGPVDALIGVGRTAAGGELSRVAPHRRGRGAALVSLTLALAGLVAGAGLAALPASAGRLLLGTAWSAVVPLIGLVAADRALAGAAVGPSEALRAFQDVRGSAALRISAAVAAVALAAAGTAWAGAPGAVAGPALAALGYFAFTSVLLVRRVAEPDDVLAVFALRGN